jgi:hypothetical protein
MLTLTILRPRENQFLTVLRAEMVHFGRDPILFRAVLLVPCSVLVAVWPYSGSALIPAIGSALVMLEPRFNNFLFLSPLEGEALSLLPSQWRAVVAAKNLAAAAFLFLLVLLLGIPIGFFALHPAGANEWVDALLCLLTILFPLLHLGNLHTLQHPRRRAGWSLGDLAEAVLLLLAAGIASIPFAILSSLDSASLWCSLYAAAGALFWWRVSLPRAGRLLRSGSLLTRVEE